MCDKEKCCLEKVRTIATIALVLSVMAVFAGVAHAIFDAKEFQAIREHIASHHPDEGRGSGGGEPSAAGRVGKPSAASN